MKREYNNVLLKKEPSELYLKLSLANFYTFRPLHQQNMILEDTLTKISKRLLLLETIITLI